MQKEYYMALYSQLTSKDITNEKKFTQESNNTKVKFEGEQINSQQLL